MRIAVLIEKGGLLEFEMADESNFFSLENDHLTIITDPETDFKAVNQYDQCGIM